MLSTDPNGVASVQEAVEFHVRTSLPDFDAPLPGLTSEADVTDRVGLEYSDAGAGAQVTLADSHRKPGSILRLELRGEVWLVAGVQSCNDFVDAYDGIDSSGGPKSFETIPEESDR